MEKNSTISRRDFIAKTALAGASLAVAQFAGAASLNQPKGNSARHNPTSRLTSISDRRKLGSLEVSAIGLGCMNIAWGFGPPIDRQDAIR